MSFDWDPKRDAVFILDERGVVLDVNEHGAKVLYGMPRSELIGKCCFDLVKPKAASERRQRLSRAFSGEKQFFIDTNGVVRKTAGVIRQIAPDKVVLFLRILTRQEIEVKNYVEAYRKQRKARRCVATILMVATTLAADIFGGEPRGAIRLRRE